MHGGRGEWEERRNVKIKLGCLKILQESLLHLRGQLAKFRFFLKLLACKLQKLLHPLKTVSLGCHNTVNPISGKGWPVLENTSNSYSNSFSQRHLQPVGTGTSQTFESRFLPLTRRSSTSGHNKQ